MGYFNSNIFSLNDDLRMRGALLEVKSSLESLTKQLEDPADEQLQAVQTLGIKEVRLPKNAARLRGWVSDGVNCLNLDDLRTSYFVTTELYNLDVLLPMDDGVIGFLNSMNMIKRYQKICIHFE